MAPHPTAERLAAEMRLSMVLAQTRFHFPGFGDDFVQLVAIRTWVHAQWTGWQDR